jgi:adenylate kinase
LRVLMLAAPGAGKGTQGGLIAEHFCVPHIATGDLLRDHVSRETDLGQQVKRFLDKGDLVPDGIVLDMVRGALEAAKKDSGGYVLDGLPRTMEQARAVYLMTVELDLTADVALYLQVGEDELIRRLLARAEQDGRSDDAENVIRRRLMLYREVTEPILGWYESRGILVSVSGDRPVEDVTREVLVALEVLQAVVGQGPDSGRRSIDLTGLDAAFGAAST